MSSLTYCTVIVHAFHSSASACFIFLTCFDGICMLKTILVSNLWKFF